MELALMNDDLLTEILLRLPAKSLTRFKSVCRKWLSLISSDYLCHHHTLRRPKLQPSLILRTDSRHLFYFNPTTNGEKMIIPYSLSVPDQQILQSCNGLMLLKSVRLKHSYSVYNPTTKRSRKISLTKSKNFRYLAGINLAFDPSKSPYYKIVCIRSNRNPYPLEHKTYIYYQIEVYNSATHAWKLSVEPFTTPDRIFFSEGEHCNNAMYWESSEAFCYLDMAKNEMKTLPCPETPYPETYTLSVPFLQESNGRLYHFKLVVEDDQRESLAVWELGGDDHHHHSQWLLKHLHVLYCDEDRCTDFLRFMAGSHGDGTCSMVTYRNGKIRTYSFPDNTFKDLVDITGQPVSEYDLTCFQFGEVLALV